MKARAKGKKKIETRDPKRRISSAWLRTFIKNYNDEFVMPLFARIALLEQVIADSGVPNVETQKIDIVDVEVRKYLNSQGLALQLPAKPEVVEVPDVAA